MNQPDVVVVGAGAAGIITAWRSASLGARTLLIEKTNRIGTKILISGGGKCNITHDGELESVLKAFRPNEARFIRPACYRFTNKMIVKMLTDRGLRVYTRDDGRIFPVDQTAKDVVAILRSYLVETGVEVRLETPITGLLIEDGLVVGVRTEKDEIHAGAVVLSTGGSSYPGSGTTGDGWPWAKAAGHSIVRVRAALAPIYLEEDVSERGRRRPSRCCSQSPSGQRDHPLAWRSSLHSSWNLRTDGAWHQSHRHRAHGARIRPTGDRP